MICPVYRVKVRKFGKDRKGTSAQRRSSLGFRECGNFNCYLTFVGRPTEACGYLTSNWR